MQVSVIIPVFNAASFVEEAVISVLIQPETAEVILAEDGSTDDSYVVCQKLEKTDARIKLVTHPDHQNLGAGETRNLALGHCTCPFVSFLDADDLYLPDRFGNTKEVFKAHPDADGVHELIGAQYENPALREAHRDRLHWENTGISERTDPGQLFSRLATGRFGHIHLNGLVLRRAALTPALQFDPELKQCQDSDWILRAASALKIYGTASAAPVALRRVHGENRVLNQPERIYYQRMYLRKCIHNHFYGSTNWRANLYLVARYVSWSGNGWMRGVGYFSRPIIVLATGLFLVMRPGILFQAGIFNSTRGNA